MGDATAWCLLALIVAAAQAGGWLPASLNLLCVVAFVALMLGLVKPWFARQQIAPAVRALAARHPAAVAG